MALVCLPLENVGEKETCKGGGELESGAVGQVAVTVTGWYAVIRESTVTDFVTDSFELL